MHAQILHLHFLCSSTLMSNSWLTHTPSQGDKDIEHFPPYTYTDAHTNVYIKCIHTNTHAHWSICMLHNICMYSSRHMDPYAAPRQPYWCRPVSLPATRLGLAGSELLQGWMEGWRNGGMEGWMDGIRGVIEWETMMVKVPDDWTRRGEENL